MLNVIIRALHGTRGMVVGAFRSDELSRLSLAFQTVDEGLTPRLDLAPAVRPSTWQTLVQLALPGPAGAPRASSRGCTPSPAATPSSPPSACAPWWRRARCGAWAAGGWPTEDLATRKLPATIEEAVLARLAAAPPDRVSLLRRLAPAGRSLELPMVRALAGLIEVDLFQALDDIVARQFLQLMEGRYVFTHDTVHQAVYDSTPERMRKAYHGRVAEVLQRSGTTTRTWTGWWATTSPAPRSRSAPSSRCCARGRRPSGQGAAGCHAAAEGGRGAAGAGAAHPRARRAASSAPG